MPKNLIEGFYLTIAGTKVREFYQITAKEPLHYITDPTTAEFTAVAHNAESGFQNIENLEPEEGRLYQCFFGVADACRYYFKIPGGTDRWGIDKDKDIGFIDNIISPHFAPNPNFEVFLVENIYPSINAKNYTTVTVTPKIYVEGFKFDLREVTKEEHKKLADGEKRFTIITIGGVGN